METPNKQTHRILRASRFVLGASRFALGHTPLRRRRSRVCSAVFFPSSLLASLELICLGRW